MPARLIPFTGGYRYVLPMAGGPAESERTKTVWFAVLLTLDNGFLDAHTYIARGGVFANVQTANVIFSAIHLSQQRFYTALAHVWPLLAFIAGALLAAHIKSGRMERLIPHSLRWTMGFQVVVLAIIGFVPAAVDHTVATVPISFMAGVQIGLFRKVGELGYLPVATTGALASLMESAYNTAVERTPAARHAFAVYGSLILAFLVGALVGAYATEAWGVHAIWLAAGFLAATLCLFIVEVPD